MFPGPRTGLGRRAKLNVCYSVPMEPVTRRRKKLSKSSLLSPPSADNSELASNDNDQHSGSGLISGLDPSSASTSTEVAVAAPAETVPLLIGKKPLRLVPPLTLSLEERKARQRETSRLRYLRKKANPEVMAEILRQKRENRRRSRQQLLANATPEHLEQRRLKESEYVRRKREKESEEQRERRLERERQYSRTVGKQRRKQLLANATPEQREQRRLKNRERFRRLRKNESEEQRERRLERERQYHRAARKRRWEQKRQTMTPEERETKRTK